MSDKKMKSVAASMITVHVKLEIAEWLLKEIMSKEWQDQFYHFSSEQAAIDHIAYNVARGSSVQMLDGFAHTKPGDVLVVSEEWDSDS